MIKINEIFYSIQGESSYAGWPTVFVRTSGCHLRCTYCDTTYAYFEGNRLSREQIRSEIRRHNTPYVCITGGEPLLQVDVLDLIYELCEDGYKVSVETSGSLDCSAVDPRVKKIIDVKTPDSGAANTFLMKNLELATSHDEFKFVICSERDFDWSEEFVQRHNLHERHLVLYSPSFRKVEEKWLAEKILLKNSKARLQLQLHKYIWSPESRGV